MTEADKPAFRWRSVSQFQRYASCSMAFKLEKLDKAPQLPAAWIAEGNAFHETIDVWEQSGREQSPAQLSEWAERFYLTEIAALKKRQPDLSQWLKSGMRKPETDIETRLKQVKESVAHYATVALAEPWKPMEMPDGSPASEVSFEIRLTESLGLRGQIDMVQEWPDGSLRVMDYKTGAKLPGKLQLRVYRLAMLELFGIDIQVGAYWMAKKGIIDGPHFIADQTREHLVGYFEALDAGIAARAFLPNVGDHCTPCAVKQFCPEKGNEPIPVKEAA